MARTVFTPITTTAHGTVLAAAAAVDAVNGNQFANPTGRAIIEITNGAGSPITVTFTTFSSWNVSPTVTYAVADDAQTVTNGTSKVFGPFNTQLMNDTGGNVLVDWSSGTSVTARVIELGSA
jgi:hypothetical protein